MAANFRKSLFGFNSDDVTEYITKTHKEHSERVIVLNERIEALSAELKTAEACLGRLSAEKSALEAKLRVYTDKYDEIERLSKNIGKLYVVANANAQAIMRSAESSKILSKAQVDQNLRSVDELQSALASVREEMSKTASDFSARLDGLLAELAAAKETVSDSDIESQEKLDEFSALINSIK